MRIQYNNASPYKDTTQTNWYLLPIKLRQIPPHDTDHYIKLNLDYEHSPNKLAHDVYGDYQFWWVFMVRNMDVIRDPIRDFKEGINLWIPTKERLESLIKT